MTCRQGSIGLKLARCRMGARAAPRMRKPVRIAGENSKDGKASQALMVSTCALKGEVT